jgi:hypothetical protein
LTSFSLQIWPSVCPLDRDRAIAASIAALSLGTLLANGATRLPRVLLIQVSSPANALANDALELEDDLSRFRENRDAVLDRRHAVRSSEEFSRRRNNR